MHLSIKLGQQTLKTNAGACGPMGYDFKLYWFCKCVGLVFEVCVFFVLRVYTYTQEDQQA